MAPDWFAFISQEIYDRLEELDPTSFETDAIKLLTGLGFGPKMMAKPTKVRLFAMFFSNLHVFNIYPDGPVALCRVFLPSCSLEPDG